MTSGNPVRFLRLRAGVTQAELARRSGTSQSAVAAYEAGSKSPTIRTLERLAAALGLELAIGTTGAMTREDRRSLALHEAIARRLTEAPDEVLALARRNLRRMKAVHPHASALLSEWRSLLGRPVGEIVEVLLDPRLHARELRAVTPFAGLLSAAERAQLYARFRRSEQAA